MADAATHPWVLGDLVIRAEALAHVAEEARAAYLRDEESCGLLVGPADAPRLLDGVVPMENRADDLHAADPGAFPRTARASFDIHPLRFVREMDDRARRGRPVKALYHSHLDVSAHFSETDASIASMGGYALAYPLAYLVTSVHAPPAAGRAPEVREHRLFVWDEAGRSFRESALTVVEA